MAEPTKKPAKKPIEKTPETKKGPSVFVNVLVGVIVLTTITLGILLATGKIKLDFIFKESMRRKRAQATADSLRISDSTAQANENLFEIKPDSSSDAPRSPDGRKYVIAGVFYNKVLCDKQAARFNAKGLSTDLIPFTTSGGNTLYRISIFVSDDLESAIAKRDEIQQNYGVECWVLK